MNIGFIQLRFDILTVIIVCFVLIEVTLIIYSQYFRSNEYAGAPVSAFQSIFHQQFIKRGNFYTEGRITFYIFKLFPLIELLKSFALIHNSVRKSI